MDTLDTAYGPIAAAGFVERFPDGTVQSCAPAAETVLATSCGPLPAQHSTDDLRRRTVQPVTFHPNGRLRALPLERPTVIETPAGPLSAELLTFHPDGSLHRIFPLNGKLSGFWTQEDEGRLALPASVATPLGPVSARFIGLCFDPAGTLLSLTLWPGETLDVPTPVGLLTARIGVSFRPDGGLRSLEPASPQPVPTPAGPVQAYDLDAVGICGDLNSLGFAPDGSVERVSTNLTQILAQGPDGQKRTFAPHWRESLCGDSEREPVPMQLEFQKDEARLRTQPLKAWTALPLPAWTLRAVPCLPQLARPFASLRCSC